MNIDINLINNKNEFEKEVSDLINKSNLPSVLLKTILENCLIQITEVEEREIRNLKEKKEAEKDGI